MTTPNIIPAQYAASVASLDFIPEVANVDEEVNAETLVAAVPRPDERSRSPHSYVIPSSGAPQHVKERVKALEPNKGRCLLTNQDLWINQCCHMVPSGTQYKIIKKLEFAWGLKLKFWIHTSKNIFIMQPSLHIAFDTGGFAFFPSTKFVDKVHKEVITAVKRRTAGVEFQYMPISSLSEGQTQFEYKLIPFDRSQQLSISRLDVKGKERALSPTDFTLHTHPFTTLPTIESHVLPEYVLFNLGFKLVKYPAETTQFSDPTFTAYVLKVIDIYNYWVGLEVPKSFNPSSMQGSRAGSKAGSNDGSQAGGSQASGSRAHSHPDGASGSRREKDGESSAPNRKSPRELQGNKHGKRTNVPNPISDDGSTVSSDLTSESLVDDSQEISTQWTRTTHHSGVDKTDWMNSVRVGLAPDEEGSTSDEVLAKFKEEAAKPVEVSWRGEPAFSRLAMKAGYTFDKPAETWRPPTKIGGSSTSH